MKERMDYTLSYQNNKAAGGNETPTVTVTGKGGELPHYKGGHRFSAGGGFETELYRTGGPARPVPDHGKAGRKDAFVGRLSDCQV